MLLNVVCFLSLGVCGWIVSLCSGCVGCCAFCLIVMRVVVSVGVLVVRSSRRVGVVWWCHVCIRLLF